MHNYSKIVYKMRSVKEFFKPESAKIHAAALYLQGAIEKERDDEVNAAKKIIVDEVVLYCTYMHP